MRELALLIMLGILCGCGEAPTKSLAHTVAKADKTPQVNDASEAFKMGIEARTRNNYEASRILLAQIEVGMANSRVEELLGPPDRKKTVGNETYWTYTLFYSQFIDVGFDPEGNVTKVHSSLDNSGIEDAEQAESTVPVKAAPSAPSPVR